ncbi:hypothetical protein [Burkholderia mayonis]|nr:hypothetical protein [Burkholderia mayonis]
MDEHELPNRRRRFDIEAMLADLQVMPGSMPTMYGATWIFALERNWH